MISAKWKLQMESTIEHGALQKLHIFNIMAEVKTIIKSRPDYCSTLNDLIIVELQMSRTKYIIPQLVCVQSWVFWKKHVKECILKLKNSTLTLKFRADQYLDFLWVGRQFCKFCQHTIDWTCTNVCDHHLKACVRNQAEQRGSQCTPPLTTITSASASTDWRREFIQGFVAESDIPLEKLRKLRPFLAKHCKREALTHSLAIEKCRDS